MKPTITIPAGLITGVLLAAFCPSPKAILLMPPITFTAVFIIEKTTELCKHLHARVVRQYEPNLDEIDFDDLSNKLARRKEILNERRTTLDLEEKKLVRHGAMLDCLKGVESESGKGMLRDSRQWEEVPYYGLRKIYRARKMDV